MENGNDENRRGGGNGGFLTRYKNNGDRPFEALFT